MFFFGFTVFISYLFPIYDGGFSIIYMYGCYIASPSPWNKCFEVEKSDWIMVVILWIMVAILFGYILQGRCLRI